MDSNSQVPSGAQIVAIQEQIITARMAKFLKKACDIYRIDHAFSTGDMVSFRYTLPGSAIAIECAMSYHQLGDLPAATAMAAIHHPNGQIMGMFNIRPSLTAPTINLSNYSRPLNLMALREVSLWMGEVVESLPTFSEFPEAGKFVFNKAMIAV